MEHLWVLLSIPAILGVGLLAARLGVLTPTWRTRLNAVAYYLALPALLFTSTAGRSLATILSVELVVGVVLAMSGTIIIAWFVHRSRTDPAVRAVARIQSYHTNFGYLGVPLVAIVFDEVTTARAALILGVAAIIQVSTTITILSSLGESEGGIGEIRRILGNPVMVALFAGLAASAFDVAVPAHPWTVLTWLGELALPLALVCTGASLTLRAHAIDYRLTGSVIGVKVLTMPVLAYLVFVAIGADVPTIRAAVLMFAMPTAVSTYVFASALGGDRHVASINVFATTVVSTGTLFAVVWLLFAVT